MCFLYLNNNEKIDYRMSITNIMEVTNIDDLKKIMKTCETLVLGFTTPKTPNESKNIVRKFLKRKSEIFRLITFVYMEVSDSDRLVLNILSGPEESFPKMYHIRNGKDILVSVQAANIESINESFKAVEPYYIDEMKNFQKQFAEMRKKQNKKNEKKQNSESVSDNLVDSKSDEPTEELPKVQELPKVKELSKVQELSKTEDQLKKQKQEQEEPLATQQQDKNDPVLEKKMNLEKLVHVNKTYDDMKISLLHNITKRKKIECEINKKKESEKKNDDGTEYRKLRKKR